MLKYAAKTSLVCYFCRLSFAELYQTFPFPVVYDFCINCERRTLAGFEKQFGVRVKVRTPKLRTELEPIGEHNQD